MRWNRAELPNYNNPVPFLKIVGGKIPSDACQRESGPLATPFIIVNTQRFAPNQYGISR
jgi:hypothetical protein